MPNEASPRWRGTEHFLYNYYICTDPFIHLFRSSLIKWMIVRINGRGKQKMDLQVRLRGEVCLGEAQLCLGGEVRLGKAQLCLGGLDS